MSINKVKYEGALTADTRKVINDNLSDWSFCSTQLDITSSTTLTNVVGMVTDTLQPGTYAFTINIPTVCTANNGSKFALKQGTASMLTAIEYEAKAYTASGVPTVTRGTTTTDQTLLMDNASGVVILVQITGMAVIGTAGTLQLQAAEHTSHADTLSVFKYAWMEFQPIGATIPASGVLGL